MQVINHTKPNQEQMQGFTEGDIDTPIIMLNLLKFKDKAEYEDGRETTLTGKQAYQIYAKETQQHVKNVGGDGVFSGRINRLMLGEIDELWDQAILVRYPSRKAMLEMIMNPDYQKSEKHRSAGLLGQLNIELKEREW